MVPGDGGETGTSGGRCPGEGELEGPSRPSRPCRTFLGRESVLFRLRSGRKGGITWKERESLLFLTFNVSVQFFMWHYAGRGISRFYVLFTGHSAVCWTFINKSAPVFLTSLCANSQGNKTIQFLSLIEIHFPFKHKNIFPR